ncbi:MAG: hypothetical protein MUP66_01615 [Candidatus Nanohaloarchaeota archaeon QJJ-5]|nr:hypothetical protein [Candidatus Nanohaloarchaeota archaeon QJJ-5]
MGADQRQWFDDRSPTRSGDTYQLYRTADEAGLEIATRSLDDLLEQTFSHYRSTIETEEQPEAVVVPDQPTVYLNERLYDAVGGYQDQYRLGDITVPITTASGDGRTIIETDLEYETVPAPLDRDLQTLLDGTLYNWMAIETGMPDTVGLDRPDERLQFTHTTDLTDQHRYYFTTDG